MWPSLNILGDCIIHPYWVCSLSFEKTIKESEKNSSPKGLLFLRLIFIFFKQRVHIEPNMLE